jgi:hypothetical protein
MLEAMQQEKIDVGDGSLEESMKNERFSDAA